jgi:hypothetical protein
MLGRQLCQLVHGEGVARRKPFENHERSITHVQRLVILAGVDEFIRRGDLRDRCVQNRKDAVLTELEGPPLGKFRRLFRPHAVTS